MGGGRSRIGLGEEKGEKILRRRHRRQRQWICNTVLALLCVGGMAILLVPLPRFVVWNTWMQNDSRGSILRGKQQHHGKDHNQNRNQPSDRSLLISSLPETSIYRLQLPDINGKTLDFSQFIGQVTMVVNTACQ